MGKHLKKLRAEKAKVQLKKKKLPKGQNITDTSFKVKKIQIAEQLPQRIGEIVTEKNQTLKDLLNHLQHHNVNMQLDGLKGITELFNRHSELSNGLTLRQVISRVLELAVEDREQKVRRGAISVLMHLLAPLPVEVRAPFTDLLSKQVQRGLSHIHAGIQRDSLRLLDIVVSSALPLDKQLPRHYLHLLMRLLTLTGDGAPTRIAVVRRLFEISRNVFNVKSEENIRGLEVKWNEEILKPLTAVYHNMARLPIVSTGVIQASADDTQSLIEKLTQALIGVWTECSPDDVVADGSVELLRTIVGLILLISQYLHALRNDPEASHLKNWYIIHFRKPLTKTFLRHFPFQALGEARHGGRQADFSEASSGAPKLVALNIDIARLCFWFNIRKPELDRKLENFIDECIDIRPVTSEMFSLLQMVLKIKSKQDSTVEKIIQSYLKFEDPLLLNLLSESVLDPSKDYQANPLVREWVINLAKNFGNASMCRLKILASLCSRGCDTALEEAVRLEASNILLQDASLDAAMKIKLHILYWCCSKEELKLCAADKKCPSDVGNYLNDILYNVA